MPVSLAEAAQRVGLHRSNLLRAIKAGRISGTRDDSGAWRLDESELVRVYGDLRSATLQPAQSDALLALKLEHAEQRLCELTRRAERAERVADDLMEQLKRIALPPPVRHHGTSPDAAPATPAAGSWRRGWRWLRSTG